MPVKARTIIGTEIPDAVARRFRRRCDVNHETGCVEWYGSPTRDGYGQMVFDGKNHAAHRMAFALANGITPADKMVLHRCGNKICVNPAHLYLGDAEENARDYLLHNPGLIADRERIAEAARQMRESHIQMLAERIERVQIRAAS